VKYTCDFQILECFFLGFWKIYNFEKMNKMVGNIEWTKKKVWSPRAKFQSIYELSLTSISLGDYLSVTL